MHENIWIWFEIKIENRFRLNENKPEMNEKFQIQWDFQRNSGLNLCLKYNFLCKYY